MFFWQRPGLARESGQKNKTAPTKSDRGFLGNTKRHWIAEGNPVDAALVRLDSLTGEESDWDGKPVPDNILKVKSQISVILTTRQHLNEKDELNIQALITELNKNIDNLLHQFLKRRKPYMPK